MPGIVKVKVLEGRNLPVMDRSADTTDAYVELKLGNITYKTEVCRKSLNPQWNSEWYKFEMDDAELQDETLQVRLMDHDTYSANDMIGKVFFNLNPLLLNSIPGIHGALKSSQTTSSGSGCISGWFPVYDTIHGLRGEINLIIKLELFSDFNKFRQSSCGVHIFSGSAIPYGYYTESIYGFVEELVVDDDPEYQWIEKIRTPRASNEARQATFYKMSGELQRKIGLKVIELGGNAIIGYRQCYDLEAETGGVVVRGIGTAVKLNRCKRMEAIIRNSVFNPQLRIPDLTITPACAHTSDSCSVISLSDSHHSGSLFGDLLPEDRWSLCSFGSRTSCNSRYTSIETLLDQTNRKPVKRGSKLLNVTRYFTSSRLRKKLASKKKHKSLLGRKFSVIEECKQKGSGSLALEIDEIVQESEHNLQPSLLQRIPTVDEQTGYVLFESSQHYKSKYFNVTDYRETEHIDESILATEYTHVADNEDVRSSRMEEVIEEVEKCMVGIEVEAAAGDNKVGKSVLGNTNQFKSDYFINDSKTVRDVSDAEVATKIIRRSNSFIRAVRDGHFESVGDPSSTQETSLEACEKQPLEESAKVEDDVSFKKLRRSNSFLLAISDDQINSFPVSDEFSSEHYHDLVDCSKSNPDLSAITKSGATFMRQEENDKEQKCFDLGTADAEESVQSKIYATKMSPSFDRVIQSTSNYSHRCMTPPISEMTPVLTSSLPISLKPRQSYDGSPNIGFGRNFVISLRRNYVSNYFSISESPEVQKLALVNEKDRDDVSITRCDNSEEQRKKHQMKSAKDNIVYTEKTNVAVSTTETGSSFLEYPPEENRTSLPNCSNLVCHLSNNTTATINNTNLVPPVFPDNNNVFDIPVTTDDENCNILREALTPSCLLMHADNLDRNTSEGDRDEDEITKRDTIAAEPQGKPRTMSESGASAKGECSKDVITIIADNESNSSTSITDCRGHNVVHKEDIEMMEYPFFTMSLYPEDFIIHLGGTVSARSVKLLGRASNIEEPEARDAWWTEIRVEIKAHMRALACNAILNYTENTSICDEICVLSATGTAAVIKVFDSASTCPISEEPLKSTTNRLSESEQEQSKTDRLTPEEPLPTNMNCSVFHIPYRKSSIPFPVKIKICELCKKGYISDVLFVTIEPLERMAVIGKAALIYALAHRLKRDCKSELNAREISDVLPFLEYDLNRQLLNKVKIKGMNAIFGLNVQVSIGEKMISAYATGTAVLLSALPPPPELSLIAHGKWHHPTSRKKLTDARKLVEDTIRKNKLYYQLTDQQPIIETLSKNVQSYDTTTVTDQSADMEYYAGSKPTCVIEVDDEDDIESISQLIDPNPPQGFLVSATERFQFGLSPYTAKKNIQLFVQVHRYRIPGNTPCSGLNKLFYRIVQALYVKIHNKIPCSLNKVSFKMDIPEPDELQIRFVGMALALNESEKVLESVSTSCSSVSELADDFILNIIDTEKDTDVESLNALTPRKQLAIKRSDLSDSGIHITSLSYIPGATISFYLGNLNFVFIRESTMVKEQTGGVNNFVNQLISDVTSIVKSHAAGIGGNAVVNFFLNECVLVTHAHKNQGQCLINVGGDVVRYVYRKPV